MNLSTGQVGPDGEISHDLTKTIADKIEAMANTARRNGKEFKMKKSNSGQSEDTGSDGHICLIIGYNKKTGEIAISDSWGPHFAERWIQASQAQRVSSQYDQNT